MTHSSNPTISIVTPSFNQAAFIENTITSILGQEYPQTEYVVIDGGSTDGSAEIIQKYADQLHYWVSEPDQGLYDAINKGFAHTTGDIMAWLNSDDMYAPWVFSVVANIFTQFPSIEWLTTAYPAALSVNGELVHFVRLGGFNRTAFFKGRNLGQNYIQQESTFWRRSLWERAGGYVDSSLRLAGDFELWARFFEYADIYAVTTILGGFRIHPDQQTASKLQNYLAEGWQVLQRYRGVPYTSWEQQLRNQFYKWNGPGLNRYPRLAQCLVSLGMVYRVQQCNWNGSNWQIVPGYII